MIVKDDKTGLRDKFVNYRLLGAETTLQGLFSALPAAVYACDAEGRISYYNRQAVILAGREPQMREPAWSFLGSQGPVFEADGSSPSSEDEPLSTVLATGVPVLNRELVLALPNSSPIDVLVSIAPLLDSAGSVCGAVAVFQNISEIKRAQQEGEQLLKELKRSNEELSQFSYAVSHDLQGPVHSVRALTQLLIKQKEGNSQDAAEVVDLIEQAANGMERLIESLLRYAQAGQGEVKREKVSVDSVLDSVRVSLAALIQSTGATIKSSALPIVDADSVQLEQLLQNLVANALKYHRPGQQPVVEIHGQAIEGGWRFGVRDNGQGVPREYQKMIFEPLKRLHGSANPGTGLGLALCRTIVARHGGNIWVESEGSDRGSTFWFTLSMGKGQSKAANQSCADPKPGPAVTSCRDMSSRATANLVIEGPAEKALSLLSAQEDERRRIARELHDDVGQRFALFQMELENLRRTSAGDLTDLPRRLDALIDQAEKLAEDVRSVSHRLHPSILEDLGLESALEQLVGEFERAYGRTVEFVRQQPLTRPVPSATATALYRITQEALRNVAKHARGAFVIVELSSTDQELCLSVKDDGPGFDVEVLHRHSGLGLISMQERAKLVGGKLRLSTAVGEGTEVVALLPWQGPKDSAAFS